VISAAFVVLFFSTPLMKKLRWPLLIALLALVVIGASWSASVRLICSRSLNQKLSLLKAVYMPKGWSEAW